MANILFNTSLVSKETLMLLKNNLVMGRLVNRQFDSYFGKSGAKIGSTANIRLPVQYKTNFGRNLQVQDTVEHTVPVVLDKQAQVAFEFFSDELALDVDFWRERYLESAVETIANTIDSDLVSCFLEFPKSVGVYGDIANQLKIYNHARAKLVSSGAQTANLNVVVDPITEAGLVDSLKGLFNSTQEISNQYKKGVMGITAGFKFHMDQNVMSHTCGTGVGSSATVSGASQEGNSLTITGLVGNLKKGDRFTINGVYDVNHMSKAKEAWLKEFVILEDVATAVVGDTPALVISPAIVADGPYQNVTAAPANAAVITFLGTSGAIAKVGGAFHKDAITLVTAQLPSMKGKGSECSIATDSASGISIRVQQFYDIQSDQLITRIDCLYGKKVLRPELGVALISDTTKF